MRLQYHEPQRGETWEEFYLRRLQDLECHEVAMLYREPWQREDLRSEQSQILFDIENAKAHLE